MLLSPEVILSGSAICRQTACLKMHLSDVSMDTFTDLRESNLFFQIHVFTG